MGIKFERATQIGNCLVFVALAVIAASSLPIVVGALIVKFDRTIEVLDRLVIIASFMVTPTT
jgi:hypothetical protein